MVELNYSLALEDRLKFVKAYVAVHEFDMSKSEDRKILTVFSDYLTGDIITNKVKKHQIESGVKATTIRYIKPQSAKKKYLKGDIENALKDVPELQYYLDYRDNLMKIKKKNKTFVKDCLSRLRETGEKVSSEAQFFKELSGDISCCIYPFTRFKRRVASEVEPEKFEVDYTDRKQLMALLRNYDYLKDNLDLILIKADLDELLENTNLTNGEWKHIMFYMDGLSYDSKLVTLAVNKMLGYLNGK